MTHLTFLGKLNRFPKTISRFTQRCMDHPGKIITLFEGTDCAVDVTYLHKDVETNVDNLVLTSHNSGFYFKAPVYRNGNESPDSYHWLFGCSAEDFGEFFTERGKAIEERQNERDITFHAHSLMFAHLEYA